MARTQRSRNPLEPLTTTVTVLIALTVVWLGYVALAFAAGSPAAFGVGDHFACVDVDNGVLRLADGRVAGVGLPYGSSVGAEVLSLCVEHPSGLVRSGVALTRLPSTLVFLGFLLLVRRLLRGANADGVYSRPTARRLRTLGWYLIGGSLTGATVQALALGVVMTSQTSYSDWLSGVSQWHAPLAVVLTGIGLVTFARVMGIGAVMSDDLEGTV